MALFLSEAVEQTPRVPLDMALIGLLECTQEFAVFNESVLRADFIIHEQSKTLTEEAAEEKKTGLLKRAGSKLVELFQKLKEMIKRVWSAVVARLKALWAKITGANGKLKVNKARLERLNKAVEAFNKLSKAVFANSPAEAYTKAVTEAHTAFETARNGEASGTETTVVKASELGGIQKAMAVADANSKNAVAAVDQMISAAQKASSDAAAGSDAAKSAGEEHAKLNAKRAGLTKLTTAAGALSSLAASVISGGAANTKEEK
jgi:hypothetical protein